MPLKVFVKDEWTHCSWSSLLLCPRIHPSLSLGVNGRLCLRPTLPEELSVQTSPLRPPRRSTAPSGPDRPLPSVR